MIALTLLLLSLASHAQDAGHSTPPISLPDPGTAAGYIIAVLSLVGNGWQLLKKSQQQASAQTLPDLGTLQSENSMMSAKIAEQGAELEKLREKVAQHRDDIRLSKRTTDQIVALLQKVEGTVSRLDLSDDLRDLTRAVREDVEDRRINR